MLVIILGVGGITLGVLFLLYENQIEAWLNPTVDRPAVKRRKDQ
jgi:hypothetical protein